MFRKVLQILPCNPPSRLATGLYSQQATFSPAHRPVASFSRTQCPLHPGFQGAQVDLKLGISQPSPQAFTSRQRFPQSTHSILGKLRMLIKPTCMMCRVMAEIHVLGQGSLCERVDSCTSIVVDAGPDPVLYPLPIVLVNYGG